MKQHPLSAAYPAMPEKELLALADDIKEVGLREPVVMLDDMVLDGWHRCQACQIAGVEIRTVEFDGDDPRKFVISMNGFRRHLTPSQRAAAIVTCMEWKPRGNPNFAKLRNSETPDRRELAAAAHVSPRTIDDAKVAVNGGLGKQVRDGKITASAAAEKVRQQHRPERTPKESPLDKARAEIAELREKLAAALDHIKELTDELQSAADAGSDDKQQKLKFAQLRQNIRALESQRDENMRLLTECKREIKALRKALGRD